MQSFPLFWNLLPGTGLKGSFSKLQHPHEVLEPFSCLHLVSNISLSLLEGWQRDYLPTHRVTEQLAAHPLKPELSGNVLGYLLQIAMLISWKHLWEEEKNTGHHS